RRRNRWLRPPGRGSTPQDCLLPSVREGSHDKQRRARSNDQNIPTPIHPARLKRALLLSKIVKRNVFERNVVQIEVTAEIQLPLNELGKPSAENTAAGQSFGEPPQWAQQFEWGVLRIKNKIAPITMLFGPAAGKNRRHASGA